MSVDFEWRAAQARIGVVQWVSPGDYEQAEKTLEDLRALHISHLRSGICWADWHSPGGREWLDWFIPRVAQEVQLLPCFSCTPRLPGAALETSALPQTAQDYTDVIDALLAAYGDYFDWIELWNEANQPNKGHWRPDPEWWVLSETLLMATQRAKEYGKKTVLAGVSPTDLDWLDLMCTRRALAYVDAVGVHDDLAVNDASREKQTEAERKNWSEHIEAIRVVLDEHHINAQLWLTEVGCPTWMHDEAVQVKTLIDAMEAPVDRVYWYSLYDSHPPEKPADKTHDPRDYHFGIKTKDGQPKLIYRLWQEAGLGGLHALVANLYHEDAGLQASAIHTDSIQNPENPELIDPQMRAKTPEKDFSADVEAPQRFYKG